MNKSAVQEVMAEARKCVLAMLENATYILDEMATLRIDNVLRAQITQLCNHLVETKHDVTSQLFELDEL